MSSVVPFRWNLTRRKELGRHAENAAPALLPEDARRYGARLVAFAGDADLCFIGRSAESFFDYLSGIFLGTGYLDRLQLLHFSMYRWTKEEIAQGFPGALPALKEYFRAIGLDPRSLRDRSRPIAFVDIVDCGGTLGNLMNLLRDWCGHTDVTWASVSPKLRIVGLTVMKKTSPKTWRWQQQVDWVRTLQLRGIKNVSVPYNLWVFLGGQQPKLAPSYTPRRWGQPDAALPPRDEQHRAALSAAVALFDLACTKEERLLFTRELAHQKQMRFRWFREMISELRSM